MAATAVNYLRETSVKAGIAFLYCSHSMHKEQTRERFLLAASIWRLVTLEHSISEQA